MTLTVHCTRSHMHKFIYVNKFTQIRGIVGSSITANKSKILNTYNTQWVIRVYSVVGKGKFLRITLGNYLSSFSH